MKKFDSLTSRLGSDQVVTTAKLDELIDAVDHASCLIASGTTIDSLSLPSDRAYRGMPVFPDAFAALSSHQPSGN